MKKTYSNASNARRAAKAAGLSEFDVYKVTDGTYKIQSVAITAAMASKAAKAPKVAKAAKPRQFIDETARDGRKLAKLTSRPTSKRAAVLAAAQAGKLPPPDFSAPTYAHYRDAAKALVNMAKAGDIEGLKATVIKPYSSSPKALAKYRDLAVIALEARHGAADSEAA